MLRQYMVTPLFVAPADMTNVVITVNGEPVRENAELEAGIYTVHLRRITVKLSIKKLRLLRIEQPTQQLELRCAIWMRIIAK